MQPGESQGWRQAEPGYQFAFPRDHAAHPEYRIEWWYYTGNLETSDGRSFGYQLTFFRTGITPRPTNPSRWAVRDLYLTHFAISDLQAGSFWSDERVNRAGLGWAGAETDIYRVWNEDWEARLDGEDHLLKARSDRFEIDLRLKPEKPAVIHGERGISRRGASTGNASHYYSMTRLVTQGRIVVDGVAFDTRGLSWMDHEFGTSFLEEQQVGWDWFSIQLDDGRDLMLFQLRRGDGSIDPHSSGTLIAREGRAVAIRFGEFSLSPLERWRSPESEASYPVAWTVSVPGLGLDLRVTARLNDQELRTPESTGVTYWEGSIEVTGSAGGRGYLEMTGYSTQSMGDILR